MTKLTIDIFNNLTKHLDCSRSYFSESPLYLSQDGFNELLDYATKEDNKLNAVELNKPYSDEKYKPHYPILSYLQKAQPEFPFNGYLFKLIIE